MYIIKPVTSAGNRKLGPLKNSGRKCRHTLSIFTAKGRGNWVIYHLIPHLSLVEGFFQKHYLYSISGLPFIKTDLGPKPRQKPSDRGFRVFVRSSLHMVAIWVGYWHHQLQELTRWETLRVWTQAMIVGIQRRPGELLGHHFNRI